MEATLLFLVIVGFIAMLFLNLYFRAKVLRSYRKLVQGGVEFDSSHFLNPKKMEAEIYPKYPQMEDEIKTFVQYIQFSIKMATVLAVLITLFGGILMYYRHD